MTNARANGLAKQLVGLGILTNVDDAIYSREFTAPDVLSIVLRGGA